MIPELDGLPPGDAVFDMDNTLLVGDIGESVAALRAPLMPRSWRERYERLYSLPYRDQCVLCAVAIAGLTRAEVDSLVDRAFDEGMVSPNPAVVVLARWVAERHRVWIVTGTAEVIAERTAPRLGVERVIGIRLEWEAERLTDRVIEPLTIQEGKVAACAAFGARPVFSIGDSVHDLPVLRHARVARVVGDKAGDEFPRFSPPP